MAVLTSQLNTVLHAHQPHEYLNHKWSIFTDPKHLQLYYVNAYLML